MSKAKTNQTYTYNGITLGNCTYNINDKDSMIRNMIAYMLNRTNGMFKYKNLPDTIPSRIMELYLQTNGNLCITEVDGELYAFTGSLGGVPNVYYMPTFYIVANPALEFFKELEIDVDCVVIPNDSMYIGMIPLYSKYATLLTENEITMNLSDINNRIVSLITASDDRSYKSALQYLKDISDGKMGIISDNAFLEGIKTQPYSSNDSGNLTNLIEYEQYLKATWYNEVGLSANYNMKREALNSAESSMNNDILFPLVDDMLTHREIGIDKINRMYGTNITVELSSAWGQKREVISGQPEISEEGDQFENRDEIEGSSTELAE